jgi:conjugal transfer pilus assembly protein TraL
MQDKYYIPQHIDQPIRVYLLTIDELVLLVAPIIAGFIFNQMLLGFCLSLAFVFGIKKVKGEQGHYYLVNLMYWYLPDLVKFKVTPPSHIREYLG